MVNNIHLEKYVKRTLNIYFPKFRFNHNDLVLSAVHAWDIVHIPQVIHSHVTAMSKYFNVKFEFPLDILTFTLRRWQ